MHIGGQGGWVNIEVNGEVVVDEGGGVGREILWPSTPPQPTLTLPRCLLKTLGLPVLPPARLWGSSGLPRPCKRAVQEGCAGDRPRSVGATHWHMTVQWVFRRLMRCVIHCKSDWRGT